MQAFDMLTGRTAMAITAASGYAIATLLMKLASDSPSFLPITGIVLALGMTVAAEIALLRQIELGLAYVVVIGVESLLVLAVTWLIGESLSGRELAGGALVIAGAALVSL